MKDAVGTVVACLLQMCGLLHADVFEQVEEARRGHYLVLYELAIGEKGNFSKEVPYAIDRSGEIAAESFARVAYYLELEAALGQMLERFYLHLDGLEDIGPIPYLQDSLLVLAGAQFRIRNIQTSGTRSRFMVQSEHSHKMYGPFENREGGTVNLGGILLKLSMWQRK